MEKFMKNLVANENNIEQKIFVIRNQRVMIDSDLAKLYGVKTKRLNEAVKRNIKRFPEDFMFQLTDEEVELVWSQNATANINRKSRSNPYVYTEQGTYMLATVLKNDIAVTQSIAIMRAFREMRHYIRQNQQFVTKNELKLLMETTEVDTKSLVARQDEMENQIAAIHESINKINENFVQDTEIKNYVIYKGQKFEADKAYIEIYKKAKKSIYVIDDYVNIKTLHLLSHKKSGVDVMLFTENKRGRNGDEIGVPADSRSTEVIENLCAC